MCCIQPPGDSKFSTIPPGELHGYIMSLLCFFSQALAEQLMNKSNKLELLCFSLDANVKDNF